MASKEDGDRAPPPRPAFQAGAPTNPTALNLATRKSLPWKWVRTMVLAAREAVLLMICCCSEGAYKEDTENSVVAARSWLSMMCGLGTHDRRVVVDGAAPVRPLALTTSRLVLSHEDW
jgi:hypothetical protein